MGARVGGDWLAGDGWVPEREKEGGGERGRQRRGGGEEEIGSTVE